MLKELSKTLFIKFVCFILPISLFLSACGDKNEDFTSSFFALCQGTDNQYNSAATCQCTLDKLQADHSQEKLVQYKSESDVSPLFSSLYEEALIYCQLQSVFQTTCEKSSQDIPKEIAAPYCACSYKELIKYFSPKELNDMHKGSIPIADNFMELYTKTAKSCLNESLNTSIGSSN